MPGVQNINKFSIIHSILIEAGFMTGPFTYNCIKHEQFGYNFSLVLSFVPLK